MSRDLGLYLQDLSTGQKACKGEQGRVSSELPYSVETL